jgi:AAA+ ATPase superfamily predicted ATPase
LYFDPRPKTRREDLYNRDKELKALEKALSRRTPLTVVCGIRRLGKTSLIFVALREHPHVIIDLCGVNPNSRESLYRRIEASINIFFSKNKNLWYALKDKLRHVSGVQVMGTGVALSWGEKRADLIEIFRILEEHDVILAFDEVQNLRGPMGKELAEILAHLYDYTNLRMILTGSEIGLLYDFLGVNNPKAPLYGRYFTEIRLERFDRDTSLDFLRKGFQQVGIDADEDVLEYAWEKLDGIVGWLVLFGVKCMETNVSKEVADKVLKEASKLVLDEFKNFLSKHRPAEERYVTVMAALAEGRRTWSELKNFLERREGRTLPDSTLSRILNALVKASFVEKVVEGRNVYYRIADPVLKSCFVRR